MVRGLLTPECRACSPPLGKGPGLLARLQEEPNCWLKPQPRRGLRGNRGLGFEGRDPGSASPGREERPALAKEMYLGGWMEGKQEENSPSHTIGWLPKRGAWAAGPPSADTPPPSPGPSSSPYSRAPTRPSPSPFPDLICQMPHPRAPIGWAWSQITRPGTIYDGPCPASTRHLGRGQCAP